MRIDRLIILLTVMVLFLASGCAPEAVKTAGGHTEEVKSEELIAEPEPVRTRSFPDYLFYTGAIKQFEIKSKGHPTGLILQVFDRTRGEGEVLMHYLSTNLETPEIILSARTATYIFEDEIVKIRGVESWDNEDKSIAYNPFRTYMKYPVAEGLFWIDEYEETTRVLDDATVKGVMSRVEVVGQETVETHRGPVTCWVTEKTDLSEPESMVERTYFARSYGIIRKVFIKGEKTIAEVNWVQNDQWFVSSALSYAVESGKKDVVWQLLNSGEGAGDSAGGMPDTITR